MVSGMKSECCYTICPTVVNNAALYGHSLFALAMETLGLNVFAVFGVNVPSHSGLVKITNAACINLNTVKSMHIHWSAFLFFGPNGANTLFCTSVM